MRRLVFILSFIMMMSACGSADDFFEDIEEVAEVDSIIITPPFTNDSTKTIPSDTVIIGNDTIITPKDSTITDSVVLSGLSEIEYIKLFKINSDSKNSSQGFAIYNNYLFNCHHSNDYIDVYNIETKEKVASIRLVPEDIVHCNNVNFGSQFYSKDDRFPLLYVQQRGNASKLNVYRIICDKDSIVSANKIQTFYFEPCSWCINTIDICKNILYTIYGINGKRYIASSSLPLADEETLKINLQSVYKTYSFPFTKVGQDTAFDNNYLYLLCGNINEGELWRVDLEKKVAKVIDLTKYGLMGEPEGIDVYNGEIIISFFDRNVYKVKILD